jgi:hypothetical protein
MIQMMVQMKQTAEDQWQHDQLEQQLFLEVSCNPT